jgi:hypothetical protein
MVCFITSLWISRMLQWCIRCSVVWSPPLHGHFWLSVIRNLCRYTLAVPLTHPPRYPKVLPSTFPSLSIKDTHSHRKLLVLYHTGLVLLSLVVYNVEWWQVTEVAVKYFPVFKYSLEGFYVNSLARNAAATDCCVTLKLIFQSYRLYVKVVRVVFLQMDLPKSFCRWRLTFYVVWGQWRHLRIKFDPLNVLLALLEFSSTCSSLEMKFYESGNDISSKIKWVSFSSMSEQKM